MKCNHCKAEWNVPGSQPSTCPFCGKPLITATETNDDSQTPELILKRLFDAYGTEVFMSKSRLSGMLSDFLSHDKKTLRLFKFATEYNIPVQLLDATNSDAADREIKILTLKQNFKEEYLLEEFSAFYAVDCFAFALLGVSLQSMVNDAEKLSEGHETNTGKEVIPLEYDYTGDFFEGLAAVGLNDKYGFIDKTGRELTPLNTIL